LVRTNEFKNVNWKKAQAVSGISVLLIMSLI
jgi:hypothetical protein